MSYEVIDIETEGKKVRNRFCDPLDNDHKVVMIQYKSNTDPGVGVIYNQGKDVRHDYTVADSTKALVGQNIKFDLLYLWKNKNLQERLFRNFSIWDTRTVDYLINSCRTDIRYNLDVIAKRYGLGCKYDKIKKLYEGYEIEVAGKKIKIPGKTTMEIIEQEGLEEFTTYAKQDVLLTEQIYLKQLEKVKELGMEDLVASYMTYYLSIIETEYNGLYVDEQLAQKKSDELAISVAKLHIVIKNYVVMKQLWPVHCEFNVNSGQHLSAFLFGGIIKDTWKEVKEDQNGNDVVFKSGKNVGKLVLINREEKIPINGLGISTEYTKALKNKGVFETDSAILTSILQDNPQFEVISRIIEVKKLMKLKTDIDKKIIYNINPSTRCLHSEFNTTSTVTGRLSSSNPNSQNLHPKTLDLFTSRWGDEGRIIEFDWSQVEVAMAAYVFKDATLTEEILNGIDMHRENASLLYCKPKDEITKDERKTAKFMTFGILYGQSAFGLAKSHNIEISSAEIFINSFFLKYKGIKKAHDKLERLINSNAVNNTCTLKSPTSKQYYFQVCERNYGAAFKSSQYKNYIIQGTAGDLHAHCVGSLFNSLLLHNRENFVIVNNVHDSIIFDCRLHEVPFLTDIVQSYMEDDARRYTGTNLFTVDVKVGKSWGECKK